MLNKVLMAIQLTDSMRAGEIVSKFRRRPSTSEGPSNNRNLSKSQTSDSYKNCLNPHNNNKFASDNYYLYEVGGNIGKNIILLLVVKLRKREKRQCYQDLVPLDCPTEAFVWKEWILIFLEKSLNFSRFLESYTPSCAIRGDSWKFILLCEWIDLFAFVPGPFRRSLLKRPRKFSWYGLSIERANQQVIGSQD